MAIEDRNLPIGTRLEATYKKVRYICTVEADEEGKPTFVLEDGKRYKSPSSAASAVMGGSAANGWRFWSLEGAGTPATRPATKANNAKSTAKATRKPKAKAKPAHKIIRPAEEQGDVPDGQVRWWCDACMESFLVFAGEEPTQCPNGHRADDPELATEATAAGE